jgi:hypothetical protein
MEGVAVFVEADGELPPQLTSKRETRAIDARDTICHFFSMISKLVTLLL